MEREIKFRYTVVKPSIVFSEDFTLDDIQTGKADLFLDRNGVQPLYHQIHRRQFTGLKDRNGKEIYEGDVLKNTHSTPLCVVFEDGKFCFYNDQFSGSDVLSQMRCEKLTVIGNIYENPELLPTPPTEEKS